MDVQKKAMIQALEKALGIVTQACKVVGISRQTHYNWMEADADYKSAVAQLADVALDFAESTPHHMIEGGNPAATIFQLKTNGKERGYVERQEIAVAEKKPLSWFTDDNADVS